MYKTLKRCPAEFLYHKNLVRKTKQNKKFMVFYWEDIYFFHFIFSPLLLISPPSPALRIRCLQKFWKIFLSEGQREPVLVFKIPGAV